MKSPHIRYAAAAALLFLSLAQAQQPPNGPTPNGGMRTQDFAKFAAFAKLPDTRGTGPYPSTYESAPDGLEFVVYRPEDLVLATRSRKLGVYIWGNGACMADSAVARFHLTDIASNGFVAVAPGKILSGQKSAPNASGASPIPGSPGAGPAGSFAPAITPEKMIAALDWILAENARKGSPFSNRIDSSRVAIGGNSCGGLLAIKTAADPRVKAVVVQNSGVLPDGNSMLRFVAKADLQRLHTPILYIVGGKEDMAQPNALDDFERIVNVPVFIADRPGTGHMGVFLDAGAEGTQIEINWLAWQLNGDRKAARSFIGEDCSLCQDPKWQVHRKHIR